MSDDNGKPVQDTEGSKLFKEPWSIYDKGVYSAGEGYAIQHRETIKTRADAPHIAVIMPVGGRDEVEVFVCDHCHKRTKGESYRAPGMVPAETFLNQMQLMAPLNVSLTYMMMKNNLSAVLREAMTKEALRQGVNYIFYWDDDVLLPSDTLYKMLAAMNRDPSIGLITGVYYTKMSPPEPVLYKHAGQGAYWGFSLDPDAEPEEIYACGAGCMMVRAETIRQLEPPYWWDQRSGTPDGSVQSVLGHDIRICRKIREETEYRLVVDGSIQCMHFDPKSQKAYVRPPNVNIDTDACAEMAKRHAGLVPTDDGGDVTRDGVLPEDPVSVEEVESALKE